MLSQRNKFAATKIYAKTNFPDINNYIYWCPTGKIYCPIGASLERHPQMSVKTSCGLTRKGNEPVSRLDMHASQRQVEGDQAPKQTLLATGKSQKCKEQQKGRCDNLWCSCFLAITKGSSLNLIPAVQTSLRRD